MLSAMCRADAAVVVLLVREGCGDFKIDGASVCMRVGASGEGITEVRTGQFKLHRILAVGARCWARRPW